MKDVIGIDLDSVLAKTEIAVYKFFMENFNFNIKMALYNGCDYRVENIPGVTSKMAEAFEDTLKSGGLFKDIEPHEYAEHSLNKLRNEQFEIYIVTSRPESIINMTKEWLKEKNLYYDRIYFRPSIDKYTVVKPYNIKAFIEDRWDILDSIFKNCGLLELGSYIVDYPWNKGNTSEYIVRVPHIAEAVDRIVHYRRWRNFFLTRCIGDVDKFIKEYNEGSGIRKGG